MQNISVTRYKNPKQVGWAGWLEPEDRSWICYVGLDGRPVFFLNRDPVSGAILSDDPTEREANIVELRATDGLRTGMTATAEVESAHVEGEAIIPLGVSGGGGDVEPFAK